VPLVMRYHLYPPSTLGYVRFLSDISAILNRDMRTVRGGQDVVRTHCTLVRKPKRMGCHPLHEASARRKRRADLEGGS
jgi:hypothetical protein